MLNMEDKIIIDFDNSKRKKLIPIGIGLLIFASVFIYVILTAAVIKLVYLALFIILALASIYLMIKTILNINNTDQVGLILTKNGITFNGTTLAKKVGEVSWNEIEVITAKEIYNTKQLYLKLKSPKKYIHTQSKIELANNGFFINSTELKIGFEEMYQLVTDYHKRFSNF